MRPRNDPGTSQQHLAESTITPIDATLLELLVCPLTKGPLRYQAQTHELISDQARLAYPIHDGIPIMLVEEARHLDKQETCDHD